MVKVVGNGNKTANAFGEASGRADRLVDGGNSRRSECLFWKVSKRPTRGRRGEEMAMNICGFCGCTESQARADAMALGLNDEFEKGLYSCCQLVAWADEQWCAWTEAASEDGKPLDQATKPIEIHEAEPVLVRVRNKRQQGNKSLPRIA